MHPKLELSKQTKPDIGPDKEHPSSSVSFCAREPKGAEGRTSPVGVHAAERGYRMHKDRTSPVENELRIRGVFLSAGRAHS